MKSKSSKRQSKRKEQQRQTLIKNYLSYSNVVQSTLLLARKKIKDIPLSSRNQDIEIRTRALKYTGKRLIWKMDEQGGYRDNTPTNLS